MKKYWRVWKKLVENSVAIYAGTLVDSISFFIGKAVRFGFLYLMVVSLFHFSSSFAGYTRYEALLFFVTFNLVDISSQALFRGIYLFVRDVTTGNFDFSLVKPLNPLFYVLFRRTDILDIAFLVPLIGIFWWVIQKLPEPVHAGDVCAYIALFAVGFLIITAIHILAAVVTLWTLENDNIIWIYRRTLIATTLPPEIFSSVWQFIFTYFLPIMLIVSLPVKGLLHILTPTYLIHSLIVAAGFFGGSLILWHHSLKHYSSASS